MMTRYTFFVLMRATAAWLALSREERGEVNRQTLAPIFARYPSVSARFFDAEAFTARCSDVAVFETEKLEDYYFVIEAIRDSKIFTVPYFEFLEIIPTIEGGFAHYEAHLQQAPREGIPLPTLPMLGTAAIE